MKKGRAGTMTHDYKRNGVTTLFAALVAAKAKSVTQMQAGEVIGECMPRHRVKEFLRFLKKIDATVARISMCTWFATTTGPTRQGGPGMAAEASAFQDALHAHLLVLV
jgi:hypothetical protein